MEGSAPPAHQWFLVEHPGPWTSAVLADERLDRTGVVAVDRWARAQTGRVLLIRRVGRPVHAPGQRRWFHVDSRPGREAVRTGIFAHGRELADLVGDPQAGDPFDGPLYLVCTHGRHDTCCALRGRPLAAALAAAQPDRTWQASHVGACRFAAAMVLLPHGVVLGGVSPADGPGVAADYAAGLLPAHGIRGRSALAPAVQAAQHHARIAMGTYDVDALVPADVRGDGGSWRVTFVDPDVTVVLRERLVAVDRPLTCAATRPGRLRLFDLVDVTLGVPVAS